MAQPRLLCQDQQHQGDDKARVVAPYTAKEAAEFVRLGACLVAWPPGEVWVDPLSLGGEGLGGRRGEGSLSVGGRGVGWVVGCETARKGARRGV